MIENKKKYKNASRLLDEIKAISCSVDSLLEAASVVVSQSDYLKLRAKTAELLGYIFFDITRPYIEKPFPSLDESLQEKNAKDGVE
jgi:hypothetical protein